MPRSYNFIYNLLVKGEDDIVGHIAYSLYKADKIAHIEQFKREEGREPEESDLEAYHRISATPSNIARLTMHASAIINDALGEHIQKAEIEIQNEVYKSSAQTLESIIAPIKPSGFWKKLGENIVVTLICSIIGATLLALLFIIFSAQKEGVSLRIEANGQTYIEPSK